MSLTIYVVCFDRLHLINPWETRRTVNFCFFSTPDVFYPPPPVVPLLVYIPEVAHRRACYVQPDAPLHGNALRCFPRIWHG